MDNFLKDNHDQSYPIINIGAGSARPPKKKRFAFAAVLCLLIMAIGIGSGTGATLLAQKYLLDNGGKAIVRDLENIPQIPEGMPIVNSAEDSRLAELISNDTLVNNSNNKELTPTQLYELVQHGVVGIEISYRTGFGRFATAEETRLVGSGFIFTTDGYVLTNHHVIENATEVFVMVDDYENPDVFNRYEAEIIASDVYTDLAVLKIESQEPFKALPIGDSSSLKVGNFIAPVGFPLGLQKSMTYGIISGLNREFENGGYELSSIQFDAAVNSGNSGGPLFDMYGNVVGIVNKKLVFENLVDNIGLAITIDEAKPIINDLLMHGAVQSRPMLGITPQVLNEYTAALYNLGNITEGILVQSINPKAPAANSDLAQGDIIIEVEGTPVANVTDVQTQIKGKKPGDIIELTVIRFTEAGSQRKVTVMLELANQADLD